MDFLRALLNARNAIRLTAALVVGAVQIYIDPLGFSDATQEVSYRFMNRFSGGVVERVSFQTVSPKLADDGCLVAEEKSPIRDEIVLVVLREDDLERYGSVWPLPYGAHGEVISRIRQAEPRALYVDFVFDDHRKADQTIQSLVWAVEEYDSQLGVDVTSGNAAMEDCAATKSSSKAAELLSQDRDVPIYFAGRRHRNDGTLTIIKELGDLPNTKVVGARRRSDNRYDLWHRPTERQDNIELNLQHKHETSKIMTKLSVSPALAIYVDQCRIGNLHNWKCPVGSKNLKRDWHSNPDDNAKVILDLFRDPLQVFWGATPSPIYIADGCGSQVSRDNRGESFAIAYWAKKFLTEDCYYHGGITVSKLFSSDLKFIEKTLNDKIVIYTADIGGISRSIEPPTSGIRVPIGVKHAMALENRVAWGDDYLRTERRYEFPLIVNNNNFAMTVFIIVNVIALSVAVYIDRHWPIGSAVDRINILSHIARDLGLILFYMISIAIFIILEVYFFRVTSLDYVELLWLSFGLLVLERNKYIAFVEDLVASGGTGSTGRG